MSKLTSGRPLEGIVFDAKSEIDRLVNENQEMKKLIDQSNSAKSIAIQLKEQLSQTQINIDSLAYKNIILSEKLSNQTHEVVDKFSNYTKRFCDQIHTIEDQKTEKLSIISDAVNELEKFLDSQSEDDNVE